MSRGDKTLKAQQEKYYRLLRRQGFKDIEYGKEYHPRIYQPVALELINSASTEYYDCVWVIFHRWEAEARSPRDLLLAELFALQDGDTGTIRGISRVLKSKKLKPSCKQSVQKTLDEIKLEIQTNTKIIPHTQE